MAGSNRDRQRHKNKWRKNLRDKADRNARRLRMDLQNIELPPDLEIMRAQALKRYKLRVFLQKVDEWTIMAHDEEEAKELVLNKGQGRPAGGIEPRIVKMEIEEMGEGDPSNALLVEKVQVDGDANVKPLIEVVRG